MVNAVKLVLLAGLAGTATWGAFEFQRDNTQLPEGSAPGAKPRQLQITLPEFQALDLQDYTATIEKPLFFADRQMPEEQVEEASEVVASVPQSRTPPSIRLAAIAFEDDKAFALAEANGDEDYQRLREGESIEGWKIARIEEDAIVLQSGGQEHRIELRTFEAMPEPPPVVRPKREARPAFQPRQLPRFSRRPTLPPGVEPAPKERERRFERPADD